MLFESPLYSDILSLFTFGDVSGSESLSAFFWFVIVTLSSALYSSSIQATFVNVILFFVSASCATLHFISIISLSRFPAVYALNDFAGFSAVFSSVNTIWFVTVLYASLYLFLSFPDLSFEVTVVELFGEFINPVGNWSTIFVAYPALLPSL